MIIGDIFERNAALYGSEPAVIFEGRRCSHGQLLERANRLANYLVGAGVGKQDRVMTLAQNCPEVIEMNAASSLAGFIAVTLSFRLTVAEQLYIIKDSQPRVLIYQQQFEDRVKELCAALEAPPRLICIGDQHSEEIASYERCLAEGAPTRPPLRATEDDVLFLVYTSGTTGNPKGVMQSHRAQIEQTRIASAACGAKPSDCFLAVMPFSHAGVNNIYMAYAWAGGAVDLHSRFDVDNVYASFSQGVVTAALLAPVMIQMLLDAPEELKSKPQRLHTIIYSSAPMPVPVLKRAIAQFGPVFNQAYGMTECMVGTFMHAYQHKPSGTPKDLKRLASAGQPYYQCELVIRRPDGTRCNTGEVGEITLKSPAAMHGYWNNTKATLEVLREGWYYTGDMGYVDEDNYLFVVDRKKDMIISGGENIYSREVEEALLSHESVYEVAVVGVPDEKWGESVLAYVVCKGSRPTPEELIEHCRTQVASFKKPRHIVFLDALPRIPSTNKIDKKQLREPHWREHERRV